jgi:hypothetical protein
MSLLQPSDQHGGATISCTIDRKINSSQSFTANLTPDNCVSPEDIIQTEDCGYVEYWVVTRVESARSESGEESLQVTGLPVGDFHLGRGGVPGNTWFDNFDINGALASIDTLLQQQIGESVLFNRIQMPNLIIGNNSYKNSSSELLLDVFNQLATNGGYRWRSRPDKLTPWLDIGNFGVDRPGVVVMQAQGQSEYDEMVSRGVFPFRSGSYYVDMQDAVSDIFIEGGDWTDAEGKQRTLLISSAIAGPGFSKKIVSYAGSTTGRDYWLLTRTNVQCKGRRYRRVKAGSILPTAGGNDPPSPAQIAAAEQLLELVGENYLNLNPCEGKEYFSLVLPFCVTGKFLVGDRIFLAYNLPCGRTFDDWLYVTGHGTSWDSDGSVSHSLELATVLDSLSDPLSAEYGQLAPEPEFRKTVQYALTGTTAIGGCATIQFPVNYATAPAVSVQPISGFSSGVSITSSAATVCLTPATAGVTVTIVVTPA